MTQNQLTDMPKVDPHANNRRKVTPYRASFVRAGSIVRSYRFKVVAALLMIVLLFAYTLFISRTIDDPWSEVLVTPCAANKTCIVVAVIKDDFKEAQTDHIINELGHLFAGGLKGNTDVQIIHRPITLDRQLIGLSNVKRRAAEVKARKWLDSQHADVLIYGRVDKKAHVLELSLLAANTTSTQATVDINSPPVINFLPLSFPEAVSGVFLATLQSQGYPLVKDYTLSSSTVFIAKKIDRLVVQMPEGLSPQTAAEVHLMYALSTFQKGQRFVQLDDVNLGIEHMRKAIALTLEDKNTPEWGQKNYYLARMLETKYEFGQVTAHPQYQMNVLEQIIEAYRFSQLSNAVTNDLEKWGESQIRFSSALLNLGGSRHDEALVDESMIVSEKALAVFTKNSPRHIKNRTSATLWFALALNRKGELSGDEALNVAALQILKTLYDKTSNQAEISESVNDKLQNLIVHLEKQRNSIPSL